MKKLLASLGLILASNFSSATIYDFSWNMGGQDLFSGYVDTQQDALFITAVNEWEPGPYNTIAPLIPDFSNTSLFPNNAWKLGAVQADGSTFDIADEWDGILGGTWGFASDIEISDLPYLNGSVEKDPNFNFYLGIGVHKKYFPWVHEYGYDINPESSIAPDGSIYSQANFFAGYYAFNGYVDTSYVGDFQASGSHRVSKRIEAPEPGSLMIFCLGFAALLIRRFSFKKH